ncbi:MAG: EF-hand domain-containing protein [Pseudomonadota bacterium]
MKRTALTLSAMLLAAPALAQTDFASVDTDKSGLISYGEASTVWNISREMFAVADTNSDGGLSEAEYNELIRGAAQ